MIIKKFLLKHWINKPVIVVLACGFSLFYYQLALSETIASNLNRIHGIVTILDSDGDEIQNRSNVVVFIDGVGDSLPAQEQQIIPKMSHLGRQFSPRVLPVVKHDAVDFFNDDRIFHNVFSLSKTKPFDLGIYPQGASKVVPFNRTGLVRIYCNIHPKMVSNILVLNNRYFAKTDAHGVYAINNLPDGDYVLRAWHELSNSVSQDITVREGQAYTKNFVINITKRVREHKNKFGKNYRKKY